VTDDSNDSKYKRYLCSANRIGYKWPMPRTKRPSIKTKKEIQPRWERINDVMKGPLRREDVAFSDGKTIGIVYESGEETLRMFGHSLSVVIAYELYTHALRPPKKNDHEMQMCKDMRDQIAHGVRLIGESERDTCLDIIAKRLRAAGLLD